MAIYFGSTGFVEIKRDNGRAFSSSLDPADVNTTKKRFSVDFASGAILTGDQIMISTKDDSNLELVSGHSHPDGRWYVHIDDAGGMKLYNSFAPSLAGDSSTALSLVTPSAAKDITIQSQGTRYRTLGKVREFEITTTRDTIDINSLGEDFRQRYERGMISGQGNMQCIWQHRVFQGDTLNILEPEFPVYLAQLAVRLDQGADFFGRFFIYHDPAQTKTSVWYEAECSVTNVAINVPAAGVVEATIDFVTTGDIALHTGQPPAYLLQENTDKILQEDGLGILLEDPTS
tara:strand:+ start:1025 stop:1888 length:864 start_codon:yes stop_codon:yes gene_type:complete